MQKKYLVQICKLHSPFLTILRRLREFKGTDTGTNFYRKKYPPKNSIISKGKNLFDLWNEYHMPQISKQSRRNCRNMGEYDVTVM